MTREEVKNLLPILQAFAEGKAMQYKDYDMNGGFEWKDLKKNEEWDWHGEYRIKPEPTYRPFKNAEECWQEMLKHQPFGWVKPKWDKHFNSIDFVDDYGTSRNGKGMSYENVFKDFTFADGSVFGIKEED